MELNHCNIFLSQITKTFIVVFCLFGVGVFKKIVQILM